jgi:hypothetical protein
LCGKLLDAFSGDFNIIVNESDKWSRDVRETSVSSRTGPSIRIMAINGGTDNAEWLRRTVVNHNNGETVESLHEVS